VQESRAPVWHTILAVVREAGIMGVRLCGKGRVSQEQSSVFICSLLYSLGRSQETYQASSNVLI